MYSYFVSLILELRNQRIYAQTILCLIVSSLKAHLYALLPMRNEKIFNYLAYLYAIEIQHAIDIRVQT